MGILQKNVSYRLFMEKAKMVDEFGNKARKIIFFRASMLNFYLQVLAKNDGLVRLSNFILLISGTIIIFNLFLNF